MFKQSKFFSVVPTVFLWCTLCFIIVNVAYAKKDITTLSDAEKIAAEEVAETKPDIPIEKIKKKFKEKIIQKLNNGEAYKLLVVFEANEINKRAKDRRKEKKSTMMMKKYYKKKWQATMR